MGEPIEPDVARAAAARPPPVQTPSSNARRSKGPATKAGAGLLITVAAQNEAARRDRKERRVRQRNAAIEADRALVRSDRFEADLMSARETEANRTQRIRRRMMQAREQREERREREPPSFGPGSPPMRAALFSHASSPPRLLNEAPNDLRFSLRPSTSAGGLPLPPPGLRPSAVEPGLLSSSASLVSMAHYPSPWRPGRLHNPTHPKALPGLASPYQRPPTSPDDQEYMRILDQIADGRRTPAEPGLRRRWERSLPVLPQNNLKGFDIPTYEQQPFLGCDKRAVPYW
jgi:hypothetical protein